MANAIEEEELGDDQGLDQHDKGCDDDREQADDVHRSDDVEDDIAGAREITLDEAHDEDASDVFGGAWEKQRLAVSAGGGKPMMPARQDGTRVVADRKSECTIAVDALEISDYQNPSVIN
jgi:hypothetical protein